METTTVDQSTPINTVNISTKEFQQLINKFTDISIQINVLRSEVNELKMNRIPPTNPSNNLWQNRWSPQNYNNNLSIHNRYGYGV